MIKTCLMFSMSMAIAILPAAAQGRLSTTAMSCESAQATITRAGAIVLAFAFTFFAMGWVGGGDAKLASAIALWLGFTWLFDYLVYAALAGGVLTFAIVQFRKWPLPAAISGQVWVQRLHETRGGIPYGIALAIGALMIYPETEWMKVIDFTHLAMR